MLGKKKKSKLFKISTNRIQDLPHFKEGQSKPLGYLNNFINKKIKKKLL
jgi:hypothetical protein